MKDILEITFVTDVDSDPDTSFLGEYTSSPTEHSIDRKEQGDWARGEHRYFTPAITGEESGNPNSPLLDYQRMEAFNRGEWSMLYCYAKARVAVDGIIQTLTSPGLGGVESDAGDECLNEIKEEELSTLKNILLSFGFSPEQIDQSINQMQEV